MNKLTEKDKPRVVKLGDNEYTLSILNLNILADIEEELDCSFAELGERLDKKQASTLRTLIWILLRENHPDITKEELGKLITFKNMNDVSKAVFETITE